MFAQLMRFGGVGLLATATHVLAALAAQATLPVTGQQANLAGFAAGVAVSYTGHARVTFGMPIGSPPQMLRFGLIAFLGLAASSLIVHAAMRLDLPFAVAMAAVAVVVPSLSYLAMRFWVFLERDTPRRLPVDIVVSAGLSLAMLAVFWGRMVNHDVAWYLFATRDWLAGAELYVDLVEVNPPLNFYLTVPTLLIADGLGIADMQAHYVTMALLLFVCLQWCGRVLRIAFDMSAGRRAAVLTILGIALVLPALNGLGQREQVMAMCFLPWALHQAAPRGPGATETMASAAFAAVGMCLKPHFVLFPLAVTILDCFRNRSLLPVVSVSNLVFLAAGLGYVAFVRLVHPAYLTTVLGLAVDVYGAYGSPFPSVLSKIAFPMAFVALWVAILLHSRSAGRPVALFLSLAAAGLGTYFLQGTGFSYHRIPFLTFSMVAAALVLVAGGLRAPRLAAGAVALAIGVTDLSQGFYRSAALPEILQVAPELGPVDGVLMLSSHVYAGPPVAIALGTDWSSSYPANWLVPGAINRLAKSDCAAMAETCARLQAAAARNRADNIADILQNRPGLLIVDRSSGYFDRAGFDWLAFMAEDPAWPPVFADYRAVAQSDRFLFFLRDR